MSLCKICIQEYNNSKNIPVVGQCGHTICLYCKQRINQNCPFCSKPASFVGAPVNHELLRVITKNRCQLSINKNEAEVNAEERLREATARFEAGRRKFECERLKWEKEKTEMARREVEMEEKLKNMTQCYDSALGQIEQLENLLEKKEDHFNHFISTTTRMTYSTVSSEIQNDANLEKNEFLISEAHNVKKYYVKLFALKTEQWKEEKKQLTAKALTAEKLFIKMEAFYNSASARIRVLVNEMDQKDEEIKRLKTTMNLSNILSNMQIKNQANIKNNVSEFSDDDHTEESNDSSQKMQCMNCDDHLYVDYYSCSCR